MMYFMHALVFFLLASYVCLAFPLFENNNTKFQPTGDDFLKCLQQINPPGDPISNFVIRSNDPQFSTALTNYTRNLRYTTPTTPKPVVIMRPIIESHVAPAILCCQRTGLQMRIRSGGHDYDGLSYVSQVPFMILDTSNMRNIEINVEEETATAQAGASVGELYYRIAEKSNVLAFPAGVCPTLGLGGHISGGGYGNLMRKYGLSVDNVIDATIVRADGETHNRESMGEDLFWAIRGGGGASFGVILSWTFKLVRVPEKVTVFKLPKNVEKENATDLVFKWEQVADKLEEDLFIRLQIEMVNSTVCQGRKSVNATFIGMFLGDSVHLLSIMKNRFPELGLQQSDMKEMKWLNSTLFWVGFPEGTPTEAMLDKIPKWPPSYLARKSDYVKEPISKEGLEAIWRTVMKTEVSMQFNPYGGKMAKISETETPFPHRAGNLFLIQYTSNWKSENLTEPFMKKMREIFQAMTPYVSKNPREAFLNYRDTDIGSIGSNGTAPVPKASVYGVKIFKENFGRLVKIKTEVDPQNFFRYEQSIPPQFEF